MFDNTRQLNSIEAEQSVLGSLLIRNDCYHDISTFLKSDDFSNPDNRKIYQIIDNKINQNQVCDVVTLSDHFSNETEKTGMLAYLGSLVNNTPSSANVVEYAKIVQERSTLRDILTTAQNASELVVRSDLACDEIIEKTEQSIFEISNRSNKKKGNFNHIAGVLSDNLKKLVARQENGGGYSGINSGYQALDKLTKGFHDGELTILAGRPAQGKSAIAMDIAKNIALNEKLNVALFSMEMMSEVIGDRLLSNVSGVEFTKLRNEILEDDELDKLTAAHELISQSNIFIDDAPGLTPSELRSKARQLMRNEGLDIIIVDFLQQMSVPGKKDKVQEMTEVSRQLKMLAMELNIPVIALASLNRSCETRDCKRPLMADLRESGSIESDADNVIFIYRDETYNQDSIEKGIAELIIRKQRNGPLGTAKLGFQGQNFKFFPLPDDYEEQLKKYLNEQNVFDMAS